VDDHEIETASSVPVEKSKPKATTVIAKNKRGVGQGPLCIFNHIQQTITYQPAIPIGVGLINPRFSHLCYLNSVFQVLFHIPAVVDGIIAMQMRHTRGQVCGSKP
jgi:hypothetical protein